MHPTPLCVGRLQLKIVLGAGGAAIKRLGSASRAGIEAFLERKVFLELRVQVRV